MKSILWPYGVHIGKRLTVGYYLICILFLLKFVCYCFLGIKCVSFHRSSWTEKFCLKLGSAMLKNLDLMVLVSTWDCDEWWFDLVFASISWFVYALPVSFFCEDWLVLAIRSIYLSFWWYVCSYKFRFFFQFLFGLMNAVWRLEMSVVLWQIKNLYLSRSFLYCLSVSIGDLRYYLYTLVGWS